MATVDARKIEDLTLQIAEIAANQDYAQRASAQDLGSLGGIADSINALIDGFSAREQALRTQIEELKDAWDDAQTANMLHRRVKDELKARKKQLDAAVAKAAAASTAKSQFLANMSHEIRTPMNGILGTAELLARTKLEDKQQRYVDTIIRSGRALLTIINDILDFSKVESGKIELVDRPFDFVTCVGDVVALLTPSCSRKQIDLQIAVEEGLPSFYVGDVGRIRQILTNVVGNSVKFTETGGVTVSLKRQLVDGRAELRIDVIDTGVGIPADKIDEVFEKFSQVDNTSARRHEGTGLGLAICKSLIERMGGRIGVTSTLGVGSTFWITLPLPVHEQVATAPAASIDQTSAEINGNATDMVAPTSTGGNKVLLVEDSLVNQEVARDFLESMGCTVQVAKNGQEAVTAIDSETFNIVLMDCQMPVMDGFQATRVIREKETTAKARRIPIIALTANAFESDREKCMAAGMTDFLTKPFMPDEFEATVRKWLGAQAAA